MPSRRRFVFFSVALLVVVFASGVSHAFAAAGTTRVSVDSAGAQGNRGSFDPSISTGGRYVAFESYATNLVSGDTNGSADVFVRHALTGSTTRVSVDSVGVQGSSFSWYPSISADGRYLGFSSWAANLVSGDTNGVADVFVFTLDVTPPTTTLHAEPAANAAGWNDTSVLVSVAATDNAGGSGVAGIYYTLDTVAHTYTGAFSLPEGVHAIQYWSVDSGNNTETAPAATIRVDTTLPQLSLDATSGYIGSATIHAINATDALSGLDHVDMRLDSEAWTTGTQVSTSAIGPHTVYARDFDVAGNERDLSAAFTVRVSRSTVTRLSGPSSVKVRKTLKLTGTVSPKTATGTVAIAKTRLSAGKWKSTGSAKVRVTKGKFTYSFKPTTKGRWHFVAKYSGGVVGTTVYKSSKSATETAKVK